MLEVRDVERGGKWGEFGVGRGKELSSSRDVFTAYRYPMAWMSLKEGEFSQSGANGTNSRAYRTTKRRRRKGADPTWAHFFGPTTMSRWATYQWDQRVSVPATNSAVSICSDPSSRFYSLCSNFTTISRQCFNNSFLFKISLNRPSRIRVWVISTWNRSVFDLTSFSFLSNEIYLNIIIQWDEFIFLETFQK